MATNNVINNELNPISFYVYQTSSGAQNNVTGDGSLTYIGFDAIVRGDGWNVGSQAFFAPVNGFYHFDASVAFNTQTSGATNYAMYFNLSGGYKAHCAGGLASEVFTSTFVQTSLSTTLYLAAGQFCQVCAVFSGGSKTVSVQYNSGYDQYTWFTGYLVAAF